MSMEVMLKRAFNQAIARGTVKFTDSETDFHIIRDYILQYAKKNDVEIPFQEIDSFIRQQYRKIHDSHTKLYRQEK